MTLSRPDKHQPTLTDAPVTADLPPSGPDPAQPLADAEATLTPAGPPAIDTETGLSAPAPDPYATLPPTAAQAKASATALMPGYEVLAELGRGGMGVVYKACHLRLGRLVALKMILSGSHAGSAERQRFQAEAEAIARLQHPNIVQVHEVGEHDGHPFFSLEFCPGGSLDKKLAGTPLPPRKAARLLETLALAIQAAHERSVVHRDLKPANVLLTEDGTPKITDFGLAKKLDEAGQTASGAIMGTPSYMAPEQAGGKSKEIGPAADVYALGAILYECLTGRPPFKAATALDTVMQVVMVEPVPPRQLNPGVPLDLETICLKCLSKEPSRRYGSARELAEDLRRFLYDEPIQARRLGLAERVVKWARRNPAVAVLTAAVAVLLVAGTAVSAFFAWRAGNEAERARGALADQKLANEAKDEALADAQREKGRADGETTKAKTALAVQKQKTEEALLHFGTAVYIRQLAEAQECLQKQNTKEAERILFRCDPDLRGWEWEHLNFLCHKSSWTLRGHEGPISSVTFSPDGKRLATASDDNTVKVWDTDKGQVILTLKGHTGGVSSVAFSPDGKRLASGSGNNMDETVNTVKVWDAQTGQELLSLKGHTSRVWSVAYSPDGKRLASASGGYDGDGRPLPREVKVWDAQTGQALLSLKGHTHEVISVTYSPDGKRLASGSLDGTVKVWDAQTGQELLTLKGHTGWVRCVTYSPDGKRIASGSGATQPALPGAGITPGEVKVWDALTGQELLSLNHHTNDVLSVKYTRDGKRLVAGSWDNTVRVWDTQTGQELLSFQGHTRAVSSVAFSPDDKRLASASYDRTVKICDSQPGQEAFSLKGHTDKILSVTYSPDGKRLASASWDETVKVWDAQTGQALLSLKGHTHEIVSVAYSPDGKRIASGGGEVGKPGEVKVWDAQTGQELLTLKGLKDIVNCVAYSPDGKRLASDSGDNTVKVWDAWSGQELLSFKGHADFVRSVAFSPDGKRLASASNDKTVKVWDVSRSSPIQGPPGH